MYFIDCIILYIICSWNFKVIGLKLLLPLILLLSPYSLIYCFAIIIIIGEDYYSLLLDMIYSYYIAINELKTLTFTSFVTFIQINAGLTTIIISLKVFISITMIVGNIIHIYLFSLLVIFVSLLLHLILYGLSLISYLLYLFLTRVEFFLYILFLLESFSNIFQSLTLSNRLSINLMAGSLLTFLLSNSLNIFILYLYIWSSLLIFILLLLVYCFEIFNCFIQLFIFMLLSLNFI
jgi:F0F1-type ATP synthase membrane subunit a